MKTNISLVKGLLSSICLFSLNLFADNSAIESQPTVIESTTLTERFSDKVILRPGIMPVGIINFETGYTVKDIKSGSFSNDFNVTGQFGIVKGLHGDVSYSGSFPSKSSAANPAENVVKLGTKYNYFGIDHVSFSASAKLPMHVMSNGEIVKDLIVGLPVVFYDNLMAGSILGDVFTLTMRPNLAANFNFDFWYGIQAYGNLWAMLESSFGNVQMTNDANQAKWEAVPFWKKLPATLSLTYVFNHYFDVGANFGFSDVLKASETIKFGVNLAVRAGSIFG